MQFCIYIDPLALIESYESIAPQSSSDVTDLSFLLAPRLNDSLLATFYVIERIATEVECDLLFRVLSIPSFGEEDTSADVLQVLCKLLDSNFKLFESDVVHSKLRSAVAAATRGDAYKEIPSKRDIVLLADNTPLPNGLNHRDVTRLSEVSSKIDYRSIADFSLGLRQARGRGVIFLDIDDTVFCPRDETLRLDVLRILAQWAEDYPQLQFTINTARTSKEALLFVLSYLMNNLVIEFDDGESIGLNSGLQQADLVGRQPLSFKAQFPFESIPIDLPEENFDDWCSETIRYENEFVEIQRILYDADGCSGLLRSSMIELIRSLLGEAVRYSRFDPVKKIIARIAVETEYLVKIDYSPECFTNEWLMRLLNDVGLIDIFQDEEQDGYFLMSKVPMINRLIDSGFPGPIAFFDDRKEHRDDVSESCIRQVDVVDVMTPNTYLLISEAQEKIRRYAYNSHIMYLVTILESRDSRSFLACDWLKLCLIDDDVTYEVCQSSVSLFERIVKVLPVSHASMEELGPFVVRHRCLLRSARASALLASLNIDQGDCFEPLYTECVQRACLGDIQIMTQVLERLQQLIEQMEAAKSGSINVFDVIGEAISYQSQYKFPGLSVFKLPRQGLRSVPCFEVESECKIEFF